MNETIFINDFISMGMKSYFGKTQSDIFEKHVVECLCDIYGVDKIRSAYESKDEGTFTNLIHTYGLSKTVYDNFLRDTVKYENFRRENEENPAVKSDIASKLEIALIMMFLYKCLLVEPTLEELSHFENDLLNNFEIIKLHFNTSLNPNKTREFWDKKKRMLEDNVELVEIKPEYLDEFTYAKFGTSLNDVKKMDYRMVEELNKYIKSKMALTVEEQTPPKRAIGKITRNTVLSTGNGFVDALMVASIIATEISIALIYLFLHM